MAVVFIPHSHIETTSDAAATIVVMIVASAIFILSIPLLDKYLGPILSRYYDWINRKIGKS